MGYKNIWQALVRSYTKVVDAGNENKLDGVSNDMKLSEVHIELKLSGLHTDVKRSAVHDKIKLVEIRKVSKSIWNSWWHKNNRWTQYKFAALVNQRDVNEL